MLSARPLFIVGSLVVACSAKIERHCGTGETVRATHFIAEAGGKGFNVAVAAHRLGVPVDGIFAVGEDWFGGFIRDQFAATGLSPDLIVTVPGATGAGIGLIDPEGDNRIAVCPAANERLSAAHIRNAADRIAAACLVIAQFETADEPIMEAFAVAHSNGTRTLLNPSPYRTIDPAILCETNIIVVNESEARALGHDLGLGPAIDSGSHGAHAMLAATLSRLGVATLIVTQGAKGAVAWQDGGATCQSAFPCEAIDSIGAGDAFIGAYGAAVARREGAPVAMRWGCAAGAIVAAHLGVLDALPDLSDLVAMISGSWPIA